MNFLESLAAEWYGTRGYFVRTNIKVNRRPNGGYDNEIDVLAFCPASEELVHIETSGDALAWEAREDRYLKKKFVFSNEDYGKIIGVQPKKIQKRAIIGMSKSPPSKEGWGTDKDIEVTTVPTFIAEIAAEMKKRDPMKDAVSEMYPCLRSIQFAIAYGSQDGC